MATPFLIYIQTCGAESSDWLREKPESTTNSFASYQFSVLPSGSLIIKILNCCISISVSCLHFWKKQNKVLKCRVIFLYVDNPMYTYPPIGLAFLPKAVKFLFYQQYSP